MSIKLFVSDIDGTLLISGKDPSQKNIEAIHKMAEAGIIFTIATGRMYDAAFPIAKKIGINVPIITYNGALIKSSNGEIIHSEYLPPEVVTEIINFFEQKNTHLQSYSNGILRYPAKNKFSKLYEDLQKVSGDAVGWDGLKNFTDNVLKLLGISETAEKNLEITAELLEKFGDKISATRSAPLFAEIMNKGVSKAAAVKILAKKYNIDKSEIAAIGDGDNDLEMLKAAGLSIAMGNATDKVKSSCDVITSTCEDDGLAAAVYKYILN